MFDSLHENLVHALKTLRGKARLTESNMREGLALVEQSLLEADVSYSVVQEFMARVTERSTGQRVLSSLDPSQQVVGIVHEELVRLMGPTDSAVALNPGLTKLMLCGLQGSGKTTTCGKLARLLMKSGRRPMLVAADLQRPAAIDQLMVLGQQIGVPVVADKTATDPVALCRRAVAEAAEQGVDVVILDTAGRLAIDTELMQQLRQIDRQVEPDQIYLVVDGMTGQDAVNSAKAFQDALQLDGVILTKLDGDARGGAVLSVKAVTGVPIKFIGTGEHLESLEPFRAEGMAGRILGMGDIVEMVRTAQVEFDQQELAKNEERLRRGEFSLDDFRSQLEQFRRPGLMQKMMGLIPGMGELRKLMSDSDTSQGMKQLIGVIDSMTPQERRNPKVIDPSRRRRIAQGAGVAPNVVNELVRQFEGMASLVKGMAGQDMGSRMKMMQEMQRGQMIDPTGRIAKQKKGTGKRLSPDEKNRLRKERERELRRMKRRDS
ncbi:MAG: signal recognition particle protein [Pirellulales bacterium]